MSVRVLSSPVPTSIVSQVASASTISRNGSGYETGTASVFVQYVGTMQAMTPYTVQISAALTSAAYTSSGGTQYWTTNSVECGRLIIKQLN